MINVIIIAICCCLVNTYVISDQNAQSQQYIPRSQLTNQNSNNMNNGGFTNQISYQSELNSQPMNRLQNQLSRQQFDLFPNQNQIQPIQQQNVHPDLVDQLQNNRIIQNNHVVSHIQPYGYQTNEVYDGPYVNRGYNQENNGRYSDTREKDGDQFNMSDFEKPTLMDKVYKGMKKWGFYVYRFWPLLSGYNLVGK